mmetsp:Transcript_57053/g.131276  ORF Transcript_57053/g.131276 Transcript_57053/m.131276 type:complete len:94 (+) Transcript_57053:1137-1418(+)
MVQKNSSSKSYDAAHADDDAHDGRDGRDGRNERDDAPELHARDDVRDAHDGQGHGAPTDDDAGDDDGTPARNADVPWDGGSPDARRRRHGPAT